MTIDVQPDGVGHQVRVSGELDAYSAPRLRQCLDDLVKAAAARTICLDLRDLHFIDSTGLGVVVAVDRKLRELGGVLDVVVTNQRIWSVFEITGLHHHLSLRAEGLAQNSV